MIYRSAKFSFILLFAIALLFNCSVVLAEKPSIFTIGGEYYRDPYYSNGRRFFKIDNTLYKLLWTHKKDNKGTKRISVIASTRLGENEWSQITIPGKAYFLGPKKNDDIISINEIKKKWVIYLFDRDGKKLNEFKHSYKRQKREYNHEIPIPLVYPDGSTILYSPYTYETRNPFFLLLIAPFTGGHGNKPKRGSHIEIIESMISRNNNNYSYMELLIYGGHHPNGAFSIHPLTGENHILNSMTNGNTAHAGDYKFIKYSLKNNKRISLVKKDLLIDIKDKINISSYLQETSFTAPLPPIPKLKYKSEIYDLIVDDDKNIYFAIHISAPNVPGIINIYYFNYRKKEWKTNPIKGGHIETDLIDIYQWKNSFYLGLWKFQKGFQFIKCNVSDIHQGTSLVLKTNKWEDWDD